MTYEEEIQSQRDKIDRIDEEIIKKIADRVKVAKKIGGIKKRYKTKSLDKTREEDIIEGVRSLAVKEGIEPEKIENIFSEIINLCREEEH